MILLLFHLLFILMQNILAEKFTGNKHLIQTKHPLKTKNWDRGLKLESDMADNETLIPIRPDGTQIHRITDHRMQMKRIKSNRERDEVNETNIDERNAPNKNRLRRMKLKSFKMNRNKKAFLDNELAKQLNDNSKSQSPLGTNRVGKKFKSHNMDHAQHSRGKQPSFKRELSADASSSKSDHSNFSTKKPAQSKKSSDKTKGKTGTQKRFVSNLKSSMKKHLKNRHGTWAMSRKKANKLFQQYYQCITDRLKLLQAEEFPIKAFMAIEGEKVMMECKSCYRPDFDEASQKVVWQVLGHDATDAHAVVLSDKIKVLKDNTLIIKDIDVDDAGQYFCVDKGDYIAIYQLDVFLEDKRRHLRVGRDEPRAEEFLFARNLRVYTTWAAWSECNNCDRPGRKHRVGQCTVQKIYGDLPIFPRDYPLMVLYPDGVPCHSTALPRHIRQLHQVGDRESETFVLPCMEVCPTEPPTRVVTDSNGEVLEVLEPGYYSVKQKPTLPPLVKRKVFYEPEKTNAIFMCPGRLDVRLVHWARGQRTVEPAHVKRQTKGRVSVDILARLHFKPLLQSDTAVYNCFEKDRRVASIKLLVVDQRNQNIKHYISYAGLALVIIGSIYFFFCICCQPQLNIR